MKRCGSRAKKFTLLIGHHKTELTEDNVDNAEISLNPKNIKSYVKLVITAHMTASIIIIRFILYMDLLYPARQPLVKRYDAVW